jgi:hypothetical protein
MVITSLIMSVRLNIMAIMACCIIGNGGCTCKCSSKPPKPTLRIRKVLFIGDSITMSPSSPKDGWFGNCGMAASCEQNDYVHRFYRILCEAQGKDNTPELLVSGRSERSLARIGGHLKKLDEYQKTRADLIVVQLGENESPKDLTLDAFEKPYERLVRGLMSKHSPIVLCMGVWVWGDGPSNELRNEMIQRVCKRTGAIYVSIAHLEYSKNSAVGKFTNYAIAGHPGDLGHLEYAKSLWDKFKRLKNDL